MKDRVRIGLVGQHEFSSFRTPAPVENFNMTAALIELFNQPHTLQEKIDNANRKRLSISERPKD